MVILLNIQWKWEDMCGPVGLQPWNETSKDFGLCFEQLFLQVPVFFIVAIVSAYFVGYRKDWVLRERTQERAIVLRSIVILSLAFIPIIKLYSLLTSKEYVLYPIDYFASGTACLSWLVHFGYVLALKHRLGPSARGPVILLVLWCACTILMAIILRSRILAGGLIGFDIATMVCHALYLLTLLPRSHSRPTFYSPCLVGSQHTHSEYTPLLPHIDEDLLGTAMQGASCYSKLIFSWVEPLFQKGLDNKLHHVDDLFEVPLQSSCSYVGARLDRALVGNVDHHQQYEDLPHQPFISSTDSRREVSARRLAKTFSRTYGPIQTHALFSLWFSYVSGYGRYGSTNETLPVTSPLSPSSRRVPVRPERRQNVSLLRALHSCFGVQFYSIGVLKFISDASGFAGPMLLSRLVLFVEDDSIDLHVGYLYAAGLFGSALVGAVFNAHFNWLMSLIGIRMKGAIVSTILRKVLSVSATDLANSFSEGEITNFMSTDTDRIVNSCPSFHALWSIPLQLAVTLLLMYQQVGLSFLAGVGLAAALLPVNRAVASRIGTLSARMMHHKDARVTLVAEMLRGMRAVKANVWEDYYVDRISGVRTLEVRELRGRKYLDAVCVVLWATTPVLLAALTLAAYTLAGGELRPHIVFTTIALVNMLIAPLNAFPWVLNGMAEAWVSIKRIQTLLEVSEMDSGRYYDRLDKNRDEDAVVILKNASFSWSHASPEEPTPLQPLTEPAAIESKKIRNIKRTDSGSSIEHPVSEEPFMLRDLNLDIRRGELIGVWGEAGSGKTSLLLAIVAHMEKRGGEIQLADSLDGFGYVPQKPWLIRGTIRENILFGRPYDEARFKAVVDACALTEDLNVLGWNSTLGSSGCTLSGGQRSRIALARAVYQEKQVYLVDDVLAAVDARVSRHIVRHCLLGLLGGATRVLVSHCPRVLAHARRVLVMRGGRIVAIGPPEEVLSEVEEFQINDSEDSEELEPEDVVEKRDDDGLDAVSRTSFDNEENVSDATVGWGVVTLYMRAVGWGVSVAILASLVLMQLSQNFTFLWLSYWLANRTTNATVTAPHPVEKSSILDHGFIAMDNAVHKIWNASLTMWNTLQGERSERANNLNVEPATYNPAELSGNVSPIDMFYLEVYFGLAGLNLLFTIIRAFLFAYGGIQAATTIHTSLLKVIAMAKIKFFDVTPTGRILNRFSSDTYTVDDSLPFIMNILLAQVFSLIGAMAVTLYGLPWLCVGLVPLVPIYYWLQRRYRIVSRHLKRLQSVTLSPVYSHFSDTLEGVCTITALGGRGAERWAERGEGGVERWQRAALGGAAAAQWLALRLQALAVLVCGGAALVAVLQRQLHMADAGLVGLAISYALSMTSTLGGVLNAFTETEREMIAVERVVEYIHNVESEDTDGDPLPYGWPSQGVISFEDVVLHYSGREGSTPALDGVTFATHPGEKVGVVGRTGAGKSSLLAAVLRLAPLSSGRVLVDGVPVDKARVRALRSRIGVIPQEPFLVSGSVMDNLDPLRRHTAVEAWRALRRCGAAAAVRAGGGLHADAECLSRGQRQLLCLARALLRSPKILLLDEATANVDAETERTILESVRGAFAGSTILLVAHRVKAVLRCDRVLLMADGRVRECGPPAALLHDHTSELYALVHATDRRAV